MTENRANERGINIYLFFFFFNRGIATIFIISRIWNITTEKNCILQNSDYTLSKENEDSKHRKFHILIHINESKSININNSHGVGSLLQCYTITTVIRNKRYASHLLIWTQWDGLYNCSPIKRRISLFLVVYMYIYI